MRSIVKLSDEKYSGAWPFLIRHQIQESSITSRERASNQGNEYQNEGVSVTNSIQHCKGISQRDLILLRLQ